MLLNNLLSNNNNKIQIKVINNKILKIKNKLVY